jgi:hypothetical protein
VACAPTWPPAALSLLALSLFALIPWCLAIHLPPIPRAPYHTPRMFKCMRLSQVIGTIAHSPSTQAAPSPMLFSMLFSIITLCGAAPERGLLFGSTPPCDDCITVEKAGKFGTTDFTMTFKKVRADLASFTSPTDSAEPHLSHTPVLCCGACRTARRSRRGTTSRSRRVTACTTSCARSRR